MSYYYSRNNSGRGGTYGPSPIGKQPSTDSFPAAPQLWDAARVQRKRNYDAPLHNGGKLEVESMGEGLRRDAHSFVRTLGTAEVYNRAITGSWRLGPEPDEPTAKGGFPNTTRFPNEGGTPTAPVTDVDPARAKRDGPDWEWGNRRALPAGPSMEDGSSRASRIFIQDGPPPEASMPEVRAMRELGPAPAPQFSAALSADLGDAAAKFGGKVVDTSASDNPKPFAGPSHQPRQQRRAGGNIKGTLARRSWGGESTEDSLFKPTS